MKGLFWRLVHNCIAHPLLAFETTWADNFHEWSADKAWPPTENVETLH